MFFVYKGTGLRTGLQLGNLVPTALFPGENRLGDEVAYSGQPRSKGPLLPPSLEQNVLCVSLGPETGVCVFDLGL